MRNVLTDINVVLAPLSGITDCVFRRICIRHGADMTVTEMLSSDALTRNRRSLRAMRNLDTSGSPLAMQIFGADPERMGTAAELLSAFHPYFIDINFGCPVRKVVKRNGGAAVLRDLSLLRRICRAVVRNSRVPVSAKIRTGWDKPTTVGVCEIARVIEDEGVLAITVHARPKVQAFSGSANWEMIDAVKKAISIPVVGNGDVRCAGDYFDIREQTGCDAVMIGRAAIGNPWIFTEIKARLRGVSYVPPTPRERIGVLLEQVRESVRELGEPLGIISIRRIIAAYLKYIPGARELRGRLLSLKHLGEIESVLGRYMEERVFEYPVADYPHRAPRAVL